MAKARFDGVGDEEEEREAQDMLRDGALQELRDMLDATRDHLERILKDYGGTAHGKEVPHHGLFPTHVEHVAAAMAHIFRRGPVPPFNLCH